MERQMSDENFVQRIFYPQYKLWYACELKFCSYEAIDELYT